jgi:PAS domain S-box-containing protein
MRLGSGYISIIYISIGCFWITLGDDFLFILQKLLAPLHLHVSHGSKEFVFVLITGLLLYKVIKRSSKRLVDSEQQYRLMYEDSPLPQWMYDLNTFKFMSVNEAAINHYGYSREEFLQMSVLDIRPAEDKENVIISSKRMLANGTKRSGIWRHIKKDGTLIYVNISSQKIIFNNRPCILVTAQDFSDAIVFENKLKQLNEDLLQEKKKLSETQQVAKVGGWEFDIKEKRLIWSDEMYIITGLNRDAEIDLYDLYVQQIYAEDRPAMIEAFNLLLTTNKQLDVTHRIKLLTGETRFIRELAHLECDIHGEPFKLIGTMQDITDYKQLELERNKYLFSLEDTLNNISEGFYTLNNDLVFTNVNKRFELETGLRKAEVIGKRFEDVFTGIETKVTYLQYKKVLQYKAAVKFEAYWNHFKKWHDVSVYPTEEGIAVYFNDITDKKENYIRLNDLVERYEIVTKATQDVIYDYDCINDSLIFNTSIAELLQCDLDQIGGDLKWWQSLIHPDDINGVILSQQRVVANKKPIWRHEYRISCGASGYKYVYSQASYVYNNRGDLVRVIGAVKNIDELKKASEENKRLAGVITKINNLVVIMDPDSRINWVNKAFEEYTRYSFEDAKGMLLEDLLGGALLCKRTLVDISVRKSRLETFSVDLEHHLKDGHVQWVNVEYTPLFDDDGYHTGYIAVHQNITERKEKENKIFKQNKVLQEISWLSSHEIRKPVASILGLAYLAKDSQSAVERDEIIAMINECAEELDTIVHSINDKISDELYTGTDKIELERLS